MRLVGLLDSPYVRRVAISLDCLDIPFTYEPLSVFAVEQFGRVNPVLKAPTLVCADGTLLIDSSLILQYAEALVGATLWSRDPQRLQTELAAVGLALAACEKSVQILYERRLRPEAARFQPWLARITAQLQAAYAGLERSIAEDAALFGERNQAGITAAVAWMFTQTKLPDLISPASCPALSSLADRLGQCEPFVRYPAVDPASPAA